MHVLGKFPAKIGHVAAMCFVLVVENLPKMYIQDWFL